MRTKAIAIIIFFILFQSPFLLAEETYLFEVGSPTMVDAYFNIFNSIAALIGSPMYMQILKLVFLIGAIIAFYIGVIKSGEDGSHRGLYDFTKYLVGGMIILMLVTNNTNSTILVVSKKPLSYCEVGDSYSNTPGTPGVQISNMPEIVSFTMSFFNKLGESTTEIAKTAFSVPNADVIFSSDGSISDYAAYLQNVRSILALSPEDFDAYLKGIVNANTAGSAPSALKESSFANISKALFEQCILIPSSGDGTENGSLAIKTFTYTGDVKRSFDELYTNHNLVLYENPSDQNGQVLANDVKINGVYPEHIMATVQGNTYECGDIYKTFVAMYSTIKDHPSLFCMPAIKDLDPKSVTIMTGGIFDPNGVPSKPKTAEIVIQAGLASQAYASRANIAAGELPYAAGKSIAEFVTSSLGTGYYMSKMIPYIQMGMRAILYAFFPFVFIVILIPGGMKVLVNYLQSLLWIELWAPTAAILDMFMTFMSSNTFKTMYQDSGFNYINATQAFSDAAMLASVAGYLYASVPALTWLILKGSGYMLGNITSSVASVMMKNMDENIIASDRALVEKTRYLSKRYEKIGELNKYGISDAIADTATMRGVESGAVLGVQKEVGKERVAEAAAGHTKQEIATGLGQKAAIKDEKDIEKLAEGQRYKTEVEKNVGEMLQKMDKKEVEQLAKDVAAHNLSDEFAKNETVKRLAKFYGADLSTEEGRKKVADIIAQSKSFQEAVDIAAKKSVDETAGLNDTVNAKVAGEVENITVQNKKTEVVTGGKNLVNKDGTINKEAAEQFKKTVEAKGKDAAAQLRAIKETIDRVGVEKLISAYTNSRLEDVGRNSAIMKKLEKAMATIAASSGNRALSAQAGKILSKLQRGDRSGVVEAAALLSTIGVSGDTFQRMTQDEYAKILKARGIDAGDAAAIRAAQTVYQDENAKTLHKIFSNDRDEGRNEEYEKFARDRGYIYLTDKKGNKLGSKDIDNLARQIKEKSGTSASIEDIKRDLRGGKLTQRELNQVLSKYNISSESLNVKARRASDLGEHEGMLLAKSFSGSLIGTAQGREQVVEALYASLREDMTSAEVESTMKLIKEFGTTQMLAARALGAAESAGLSKSEAEKARNIVVYAAGVLNTAGAANKNIFMPLRNVVSMIRSGKQLDKKTFMDAISRLEAEVKKIKKKLP